MAGVMQKSLVLAASVKAVFGAFVLAYKLALLNT